MVTAFCPFGNALSACANETGQGRDKGWSEEPSASIVHKPAHQLGFLFLHEGFSNLHMGCHDLACAGSISPPECLDKLKLVFATFAPEVDVTDRLH